jgi:lipid II:glycine glycyltransferase (peptidoglycan interpeptide bridge formation enzyme)
VRALVAEYVDRRRMVLRINPRCLLGDDDRLLQVLSQEGFSELPHEGSRRSLVMELSEPLDHLRTTLDKKWRNCLSKAERSGLTIASGTSLGLFDEFTVVYERMLDRKQFAPTADIQKHRRIQERLPEELRMGIVLARQQDAACAGAIYSALGDTALYLFGATDEVGMRSSASYLVQWTVISELKTRGVRQYDLNGINADTNPGTYHFKKGLAGKGTPEVAFASQVQTHHASLTNRSILLLDRLRLKVRANRAGKVAATA